MNAPTAYVDPDGLTPVSSSPLAISPVPDGDEPSEEECSVFEWYRPGRGLGYTDWQCQSHLTRWGRMLPPSLQRCVLVHEAEHGRQCWKYTLGLWCMPFSDRIKDCAELQADRWSIGCARVLLLRLETPETERLEIRCYLKNAKRNCRNHRSGCPPPHVPETDCDRGTVIGL